MEQILAKFAVVLNRSNINQFWTYQDELLQTNIVRPGPAISPIPISTSKQPPSTPYSTNKTN